jgi:exodeoxyribonuclease VII large subunit
MPGSRDILTVTDLTRRIKAMLESGFPALWVSGEASNVKYHQSGHVYFSLKDPGASLRCVLFRGLAARLKFRIEEGAALVLFGRVSVYESMGAYELIVERAEPKGVGALQLAFEQMKEKLEKEGLFDPARKRPLPVLPAAVGIVTSPTGAALRDILTVIDRRFPRARLVIYPCRVQGEGAADEVAEAIRAANARAETEVLIVGRGGGSIEDLWAFNEEPVARAIAVSAIPVVSAVGHEVDITIADLVADKRALTPSEAAELVLPKLDDLLTELASLRQRLRTALRGEIDLCRERVKALAATRVLRDPMDRIRQLQQRLDDLASRLPVRLTGRLETARQATASLGARMAPSLKGKLALARARSAGLAGRLEGLSPLRVLARGYSVTMVEPPGADAPEGRDPVPARIVKSAKDVKPGDRLRTRLGEGEVRSRVE